MSNATIAIIVTVVLSVSALLWTVLRVQRRYGARSLLRGLGLVLIPVGLWFSGVMELLVSGARGVYRFLTDGPVEPMEMAGLIVLAVGLLLFIVASAIKPVSKEEAQQRRLAREQKEAGVAGRGQTRAVDARTGEPRTTTAVPAGSSDARVSPQAPRKQSPASGLDSEDAEIEALLRKRGIE